MTKRDFELIARVLREYDGWPHLDDPDVSRVRADLAHDFAAALAGTNGGFDRERFLKACLS